MPSARRPRPARPAAARPAATPPSAAIAASLEAAFDGLDTALLGGDRRSISTLTGQLWAHRRHAPAVLVERLRTGRARIPAFALEQLIGFAGEAAPRSLLALATDRQLPDLLRWEARRRAGWPEGGEATARRTFLASLADAETMLVTAIAQAGDRWPPDLEVLQEALAGLLVLAAEQRRLVAEQLLARATPGDAWLLRGLLHVPEPALQQLVIDGLSQVGDGAALGALDRLARTTSEAAVRTAAQAAQRRLRLQVATPEPAGGATSQHPAWPALDQVRVSEIDGDGGQLLVITRTWAVGQRLLTGLFWKDHVGLRDAWGVEREPVRDGQGGLFEHLTGTMQTVVIDLATARGLVAQAVATSAATGEPLPPALELWLPFLHDTFPPAADEPVATPELDDRDLAGRDDLVRRSARLFDHRAFAYWFFNPEEIMPVLAAIPRLGTPPAPLPYAQLIPALVGPVVRDRFRWRLRRQAWLLARQGERGPSELALAVAASLAEATPAALSQHPFLKTMIDRSVANAVGTLRLP